MSLFSIFETCTRVLAEAECKSFLAAVQGKIDLPLEAHGEFDCAFNRPSA
jgi:hypothetical protein